MPHTLSKAERLNQKKVIGRMFRSGSRSFTVFPLRVVYMDATDDLQVPVAVMTSVSKRYFKHAVKRNRVKRQIREAYRLNKDRLVEFATANGKKIAIDFIYLSDRLFDTSFITKKVCIALSIIEEKLHATMQER